VGLIFSQDGNARIDDVKMIYQVVLSWINSPEKERDQELLI
jgi:hypothetical protein